MVSKISSPWNCTAKPGRPFIRLGRGHTSVFKRFHRGEKNNVSYRRTVCQKHHDAVYPYAETPCRRHSVLERVNEILVHHARLVVSLCTQLDLLCKTFPLVYRVVELRKSVADFVLADEQLEALRKPGVFSASFGKRRHVDRVHCDKRRLDDAVLHFWSKHS